MFVYSIQTGVYYSIYILSVRTLLKQHIWAFTTLLQTIWESECAFNMGSFPCKKYCGHG